MSHGLFTMDRFAPRSQIEKFLEFEMKILFLVFLFLTTGIYGQTNSKAVEWANRILNDKDLSKTERKKSIAKYDFGSLWTSADNSSVFGFIGPNFQRLRVKIISAAKTKKNPYIYTVSGKSMVKNNICSFTGTFKILKARTYRKMHWGLDDDYKNKGIKRQGIVTGEYRLTEDRACIFRGTFEGRLLTRWYIDSAGKLMYDDIQKHSDTYANNQFVGTWKSHRRDIVKTSNWGDHRIPLSGDLDIGVGEFSPDNKYLFFGWQTYRDAYFKNDERARREEEREWWK